jgi:hypothetical protein
MMNFPDGFSMRAAAEMKARPRPGSARRPVWKGGLETIAS